MESPLLSNDADPSPSSSAAAATTNARTYVAGEGEDRLADEAHRLGLEQRRRPMPPVRNAVRKLFQEELAVHMHSVGALGNDERVDAAGTLHYVSVRRRARPKQPTYGTLEGLFHVGEPIEVIESSGEEEGEEEDEQEERVKLLQEEESVEGGSLSAAVFGIVKGTVGPAILYLPHGFQQSGYAVAIPAMLFSTFMYIFNACRLLDCWKVESDRNHQRAERLEQIRSFLLQGSGESEAASFTPALLTYPELARRALGHYGFFVELGIALMQFGVCLTYLIFVPQNLRECTLIITGRSIPKVAFLAMMVLIEIPLTWIRDIRKLTPTNVVATFLIAYGLISVLVLAFDLGLVPSVDGDGLVFKENLETLHAWTDSWYIFIGTSFFMMEGSITLLVPLQEAVYLPQDKTKFPALNMTVTTWIVVFYIFFSMICVAAFGQGIRTAMTASLRGKLATTVQMAYSIAVILTFPLQAFPAMQVACKAFLGEHRSKLKDDQASSRRTILATCLVLLLGVIASVAIDYLGNVVSILGSLFGVPLALVFPPLMHNVLVKDSSVSTKRINYGICAFGFLAMGLASFATIVSWNQSAD